MTTHTARLVGSIRVLPNLDTIGIPVFATRAGNTIFVCETDAQLRITDFIELLNESDFHLDYGLPPAETRKSFSLGDAIPIPVWIEDRCEVVPGDTEPAKLDLNAKTDSSRTVLADVRKILGHARNGTFERANFERRFSHFQSTFQEIFEEPPVHSRYWISRMGIAASAASRLEGPTGALAQRRLRSRVIGWVQWFGPKCNVSLLGSLLESTEGTVLSAADVDAIWAAYVAHKLAVLDWSFVTSRAAAELISENLPGGLVGHFLENGVPLRFEKLKSIPDYYSWFTHRFAELERLQERERAWKLTYLLFGDRDLPVDLSGRIAAIRSEKLQQLNQTVRDDMRTFFSYKEKRESWGLRATELLQENEEIVLLSRILDGTIRSPSANLDPPPGLALSVVKELERYAEEPAYRVGEAGSLPFAPSMDIWLQQNTPVGPDEMFALTEATNGVPVDPYWTYRYRKDGLVIQGWSSVLALKDRKAVRALQQLIRKTLNPEGGGRVAK